MKMDVIEEDEDDSDSEEEVESKKKRVRFSESRHEEEEEEEERENHKQARYENLRDDYDQEPIGNEEVDEEYDENQEHIQRSKKKKQRRDIPMTILVICDGLTGAIGRGDNQFPWSEVPNNARKFVSGKIKEKKDPSKRHAVLMGRTVFTEFFNEKPYPGCVTAILSRSFSLYGQDMNWVTAAPTMHKLYKKLCKFDDIDHIYVIGGAYTFSNAMKKYCNDMYVMYYHPKDEDKIYDDYDHRIVFRDRFMEEDTNNRENMEEGLQLRYFVRKPEEEEEPEEDEDL